LSEGIISIKRRGFLFSLITSIRDGTSRKKENVLLVWTAVARARNMKFARLANVRKKPLKYPNTMPSKYLPNGNQ